MNREFGSPKQPLFLDLDALLRRLLPSGFSPRRPASAIRGAKAPLQKGVDDL
jgi:hypothetical protein